jgi:hypothetical protein
MILVDRIQIDPRSPSRPNGDDLAAVDQLIKPGPFGADVHHGLGDGRKAAALKNAGSNRPVGSKYNRAIGNWLRANGRATLRLKPRSP